MTVTGMVQNVLWGANRAFLLANIWGHGSNSFAKRERDLERYFKFKKI